MERYSSRKRNELGKFIKLDIPVSIEEKTTRNKEYQKVYNSKNKERIKEFKKRWATDNQEKIREWRKNNLDKVRETKRKYKKSRPDVILRENLRTRLAIALKYQRVTKNFRTMDLIGCSIPEFKKHIAKLFKKGMNWDNRGLRTWHIDHIKPLSLFDLSDLEQRKKAFHYTNMQPLWAKDNLIKSNKYDL